MNGFLGADSICKSCQSTELQTSTLWSAQFTSNKAICSRYHTTDCENRLTVQDEITWIKTKVRSCDSKKLPHKVKGLPEKGFLGRSLLCLNICSIE